MRKIDLELSVGFFVLAGILCLGFLSIKVTKAELFSGDGYQVYAIFPNVGGLQEGAATVIAGVKIGRITSITLEDYQARVAISLPDTVKIQDDAIASIKTRGLIGQKYIEITPGGSDTYIPAGGKIRETIPPVDVEELISKYVFGKVE